MSDVCISDIWTLIYRDQNLYLETKLCMIGRNENAHFQKTRFSYNAYIQRFLRCFVAVKDKHFTCQTYEKSGKMEKKRRFKAFTVFPLLFRLLPVFCFHSTAFWENLSYTPRLLSHELEISLALWQSTAPLGRGGQSLSKRLFLKYFEFRFLYCCFCFPREGFSV